MKKRAMFISGGGNRIVYQASIAYNLIKSKNIRFDAYYGIGSGAILATLLALGEFDYIRNELPYVKPKALFGLDPSERHGKLIMLSRMAMGKRILTLDNLERYLREIISESRFLQFSQCEDGKKLHVQTQGLNDKLNEPIEDYELLIKSLVNAMLYTHNQAFTDYNKPANFVDQRPKYNEYYFINSKSATEFETFKSSSDYITYIKDLAEFQHKQMHYAGLKSDQVVLDYCHRHLRRCEIFDCAPKLPFMYDVITEDQADKMWSAAELYIEQNTNKWKSYENI